MLIIVTEHVSQWNSVVNVCVLKTTMTLDIARRNNLYQALATHPILGW